MPALKVKYSLVSLILSFFFLLIFSQSALAVDLSPISKINYRINGQQRYLKLMVVNPYNQEIQPKLKLVISDEFNRIKHQWLFDKEISVSARKQAEIELSWQDDRLVQGRETAGLYWQKNNNWQLIGQARSEWSTAMIKNIVLSGFIVSLVTLPLVFRNFPNQLISFLRKGVNIYAQRSA